VTTLNNLAKAYNGIKEYQKAQEIIEDVIKEAPDYRDAYLTLADIKENTGNHKESLDALVKAKALSAGTNFIDKKIISLREEPEPVITDKVYLKNGRVIEGIIKEKTDKRVVLEIKIGSSEGEISLQQEDIERIAK
jgi:tetratricopeptide (TPR) repeat protein